MTGIEICMVCGNAVVMGIMSIVWLVNKIGVSEDMERMTEQIVRLKERAQLSYLDLKGFKTEVSLVDWRKHWHEMCNRVDELDNHIRVTNKLKELVLEFGDDVDKLEKKIAGLSSMYKDFSDSLCDNQDYINKLVTCETCGCLVDKKNATRGESVIENKRSDWQIVEGISNETIRERWFCKEHAPEA